MAIVGASDRNPFAARLVRNMARIGFAGELLFVNERRDRVFDAPCYHDLAALPRVPDLVAVSVPAPRVHDVVRAGLALGCRAFVVNSAGFADSGPDGSARQERLAAMCNAEGALLLGPNCMGFVGFGTRAAVFGAPLPARMAAGSVGVVSQSGSAAVAIMNAARDFGFTTVASTGNEASVTAEDVVGRLLEDGETRIVALFLETLRKPRIFFDLARRAQRQGLAVVVLKVGSTPRGSAAAFTHTGALAGEAEVFEGAFRDLGVTQVRDLDELIETLELFTHLRRPPRGPAIAVLGLSGGELALAADTAGESGVALAELGEDTTLKLLRALNADAATIADPVDLGLARVDPSAFAEVCTRCVTILADDPAVGAVAIAQDAPRVLDPDQVPLFRSVVSGAARAAGQVEVPTAVFTYLSAGLHDDIVGDAREAGLAVLQGVRPAMRALAHLARRSRPGPPAEPPLADPLRFAAALPGSPAGGEVLVERMAKRLLGAYGVRTTRDALARNADEAVAAAERIGLPVVLKVESADIVHKRAAGGVRTGLGDPAEVRRAFADILAAMRQRAPSAHIAGVVVAEEVGPGVELFLGAQLDEGLGPVVAVGLGGTQVEALRRVAFGLPPATEADALRILERVAGYEALRGPGAAPLIDVAAVARAMVAVARLAVDGAPILRSLDVNPLVVYAPGGGCCAVDAAAVIVRP